MRLSGRNTFRNMVCLGVLLALMAGAMEARKRDPLTPAETDQLREAADQPPKKIKLYLTFGRTRLLAIDQLRGDPKFAAERGKQVHDLLDDFDTIVKELEDNLDMYDRRGADLRKVLKDVIEAQGEWTTQLKALQHSGQGETRAEARHYEIVLTNVIDELDGLGETAREILKDQTENPPKPPKE